VGTLIGVIVLMNMRSNTSSLDIRIDDYKAAIQSFKNDVIFGNGYGNEEEIKKYMSDFREYNDGLSNSIAVILAQGGIYFSMIYIFPILFLAIYAIKKKNIKLGVLVILFIFSISISIYHTTPLMLLILSMMYVYIYSYYMSRKDMVIKNVKIE
jgi:O-antigen ligase